MYVAKILILAHTYALILVFANAGLFTSFAHSWHQKIKVICVCDLHFAVIIVES